MVRHWLQALCCTACAVVLLGACAAPDDGAQQRPPGLVTQPPTTDAEPPPGPSPSPTAAGPQATPTRGAGPPPTVGVGAGEESRPPTVGAGEGRPPGLADLLDEAELTAFSEGCDTAARQYVQGDVAYPRSLPAAMGEAASYEAAVRIRQVDPSSPTDLIDAADPTEEPVKVQCLVAARLVAVSETIDVEEPDEAGDGGWVYQEFTPDGTLEWAWSVTATAPRDGTLRLEMRPAVKGFDVTEVTRGRTARFSSDVVVDASWLQRGAYWTQHDGQALTVLAGFLGAALLGLLAFVPKVRDAVKGALGRGGGAAPQPAPGPPTSPPPLAAPVARGRPPGGAPGRGAAGPPARTRKKRAGKR